MTDIAYLLYLFSHLKLQAYTIRASIKHGLRPCLITVGIQ